MDQTQKSIRQKERQDYAEEQERRYNNKKWDQTDNPEIPNEGETSEIPRQASLRGH